MVQTGLSMVSGRVAYGLPHNHGVLREHQSSGDLKSRAAVSHPVSHWLGGFTSLKALQWKCELVEATKASKSRLGLFISFSCSCSSLSLNSRSIERLEPDLRWAESTTGNRHMLQQGSWQLDTGEMAPIGPDQTPEQGKQ